MLRPFEVRPRNSKADGHVLKCYFADDVRAAFDRYAARPPSDPLPRYRFENKEEPAGNGRYHRATGSGSIFEKSKEEQGGSGVAGPSGRCAAASTTATNTNTERIMMTDDTVVAAFRDDEGRMRVTLSPGSTPPTTSSSAGSER